MKPGKPGHSHSHDFFGNFSTNAFSSYESLMANESSCKRSADTAAYWVPTLYRNEVAIPPRKGQIYYTRAGDDPVQPFPGGLCVVAGDSNAQGPQPEKVIVWKCDDESGARSTSVVPTCATRTLTVRVRFPACWDGRNVDSPDHRAHLAYRSRGRCPRSHPVAVPQIALNVRYPIRGGAGIRLSSGPPYTAHADFFNSWDQAELSRLVATCLNAGQRCEPTEPD